MKVGDIVRVKGKDITGEVIHIDNNFCAIKTDDNVSPMYDMNDLEVLEVKVPKFAGTVVNILGVPYVIRILEADDYRLDSGDGVADHSVKALYVENFKYSIGSLQNLEDYQKQVIRHEIIHAFLYESGLDSSSFGVSGGWAKNEEMVDWIAIQFPKILEAYKEAGVI